jgi:hypothetical protein
VCSSRSERGTEEDDDSGRALLPPRRTALRCNALESVVENIGFSLAIMRALTAEGHEAE